jgi:hypothetical protein
VDGSETAIETRALCHPPSVFFNRGQDEPLVSSGLNGNLPRFARYAGQSHRLFAMPELNSYSLTLCDAVLVAYDSPSEALLSQLATAVGFRSKSSTLDSEAEQIPAKVKFFLVHEDIADSTKSRLLRSIRSASSDDMKFSPVVIIANDCSFEDAMKFVAMGFDDVVSLPEHVDVLRERLLRQVTGTVLYVQSPGYLGPDRRRLEAPDKSSRRRGEFDHSVLTLRRDPVLGTTIENVAIFA